MQTKTLFIPMVLVSMTQAADFASLPNPGCKSCQSNSEWDCTSSTLTYTSSFYWFENEKAVLTSFIGKHSYEVCTSTDTTECFVNSCQTNPDLYDCVGYTSTWSQNYLYESFKSTFLYPYNCTITYLWDSCNSTSMTVNQYASKSTLFPIITRLECKSRGPSSSETSSLPESPTIQKSEIYPTTGVISVPGISPVAETWTVSVPKTTLIPTSEETKYIDPTLSANESNPSENSLETLDHFQGSSDTSGASDVSGTSYPSDVETTTLQQLHNLVVEDELEKSQTSEGDANMIATMKPWFVLGVIPFLL